MKKARNVYMGMWVALIALLISSLILLLMIPGKDISRFTLAAILWIIILAAGGFLFTRATSNYLAQKNEKPKSDDAALQNRSAQPRKAESLEINSVAGKISRRINITAAPEEWGNQILKNFVKELEIMSGVFYCAGDDGLFKPVASYAIPHPEEPFSFHSGEGLTGQAVKNQQVVVYRNIPEDYTDVFSGLGSTKPSYIAIMPLLLKNKPAAALEVAGFRWADEQLEQLFQSVAKEIAQKFEEVKEA